MSNDLTRVHSNEVPAFLTKQEYAGVNDDLKGFVRPPRIKIVQGTARPPVSDKFQRGDVILMPTMTLLAGKGESFKFVPLMLFPEWLLLNPVDADEMIVDRSYDAMSEIAQRSRDPKRREQPWPKDVTKMMKNAEVLNFLVLLQDHPLGELMCLMTFMSAEHKTGTAFATSLKLRQVPMCGTIWEAKVRSRRNNKGSWDGFDIAEPTDGPAYVSDVSTFERYLALREDMKSAHEAGKVVVDYDESDETDNAPRTEF